MRRRLVVMVKEPQAGRVKTRLGQQIGMVPAAWWMRHQLHRLLRELRDPRWELWLAVAPDGAVASRMFPADLPRVAQGPGDLGDRMGRVLRRGGDPVARRGATGPVCIIGADIPGVTRAHVWRAFTALGTADAVFGPAPDGGYWLIGMKGVRPPPPGLFQGVRWSSPHALADTLATLPGLRVAMVDTLADVDEAADL
jgi:hypothetical protein